MAAMTVVCADSLLVERAAVSKRHNHLGKKKVDQSGPALVISAVQNATDCTGVLCEIGVKVADQQIHG
jgi:hypothetical protein